MMENRLKVFCLFCLFFHVSMCIFAQSIEIEKRIRKDGKAHVTRIKNNLDYKVSVTLYDDGASKPFSLKPGELQIMDLVCTEIIYNSSKGGGTLWNKKNTSEKPQDKQDNSASHEGAERQDNSYQKVSTQVQTKPEKEESIGKRAPSKSLSLNSVILDFNNYLENIPFYSLISIEEDCSVINEHINGLKNWKDKEEYIKGHHLNSYVSSREDSIVFYSDKEISLITDFIELYGDRKIANRKECVDSLHAILKSRTERRETDLKRLSDEISNTALDGSFDWKTLNWKMIGICAGFVLLMIVLFAWFRKANKKSRPSTLSSNNSNSVADESSAIVVRRKTTSILRKQSLEDVIGNSAYLQIDCNDFCDDSAVRRMYIKNTCIKDIYNMYAEDLRNPNNPKEDGCMVLGRWVHDAESNEYYVSLEHIVLPGDDAVFAEYELNFGGKIKLKVTEKLRKLRRETNLQYDLTCWVHSHPGLGVFFSNSDNNVQMQLKHPTHPLFLTAMVVDILTPEQELGFFTFKRDSTINSKADIKKMYSLEELYKWAVESDRNSFKAEDYYNTMANVSVHANDCYGIELSNGAIIDMCMVAAEQNSGLVGLVHGFRIRQETMDEYVAVAITKNEAVPDNELVGCFIMTTHRSIPTIKKAVSNYLDRIKFVLVYTAADGLLTSIPVISQDLCQDENYYGEQQLEELKVWTRRKR